MRAELTIEQKAKALARKQAGEEWDAIGPTFGMSGNAIRKQVRRAQNAGSIGEPDDRGPAAPSEPAPGISWTESRDGATLESGKSATIRTLDDLLAACEVDLSRWTVDRFVVNKWDSVMRGPDDEPVTTELFQVKAWLAPIKGAAAAAELVASLIADMEAHAPRYPAVQYAAPHADDRYLAVISLADHHIGALSWMPETGANYDMAIAEELAAEAMTEILRKVAMWQAERIMIIVGNDLMHVDRTVDGKGGSTTKGTIQETDGRWQKMFRVATRVTVAAIDQARTIAPVEARFKAGNHDTQSLFMLGEVVGAHYRHDASVTVINEPAPRDYVEYGVNAIGVCHGHNEKRAALPLLMATEAPAMWARTVHRHWLTGHNHAEKIVRNDESGVIVHTLPSLCAPDGWHIEKGYHHARSSVAIIYHHDTGPAAHLMFHARRAA